MAEIASQEGHHQSCRCQLSNALDGLAACHLLAEAGLPDNGSDPFLNYLIDTCQLGNQTLEMRRQPWQLRAALLDRYAGLHQGGPALQQDLQGSVGRGRRCPDAQCFVLPAEVASE